MIYLDYAATSPILPSVSTAMSKAAKTYFANASALHTPGHLAKQQIEQARRRLAKTINANPDEIIFVSSSTEANNTVINIFKDQPIAASAIEHDSVLRPAQKYAKPFTSVKIDKNGVACYNEKIWDTRPKLLSLIHASNEIGTIQNLSFWTEQAHSHNALIHSDCTQTLGKLPINVKQLNLDYATFSAHKIGGPVGVAALYVKKGAPFKPLLLGGGQEENRRAGTSNTLAIIGFDAALQYLDKHQTPQIYTNHIAPLRDRLAQQITQQIPNSLLSTPINITPVLSHILNVSFPGAEGESIQLMLDAQSIIVSTGSACAAHDSQPSHVLMAQHHDAEIAHSSIRFSLGPTTTAHEIDQVVEILPSIVQKLRSISTTGATQ